MEVKFSEEWLPYIEKEFDKPYFSDLAQFVKKEYEQYACYPKGGEIFAAFSNCAPKDLKVVVIGQDPYHGPGQANGLCFSVSDGQTHPPSLVNIFKELQSDINVPYPPSGNLERWARQGVLLLNATLTVRAHKAGSHQGQGWEIFTDAVIDCLDKEFEHLVFLLWGNYAKRKARNINTERHCVLHSGHPSPLSANRGLWFGNKHFSQANAYLQSKNIAPVQW